MFGISTRQLVILGIVLVIGWLIVTAEAKTAILWDVKNHFGLLVLFGIETCVVAWLLQWRRTATIFPMLIAAWIMSRWASQGLPCVLPLRSGEIYYASVITPLLAFFGVRLSFLFNPVGMWSGGNS